MCQPCTHLYLSKETKVLIPGVQLTVEVGGGGGGWVGSERGSYFIPQKIPMSEFVYPPKSLLFVAYPKKSHTNSKLHCLMLLILS